MASWKQMITLHRERIARLSSVGSRGKYQLAQQMVRKFEELKELK